MYTHTHIILSVVTRNTRNLLILTPSVTLYLSTPYLSLGFLPGEL